MIFASSSNPRSDDVPAEQFIWAINGDILGMGDREWWDQVKQERVSKRRELKAEKAMAAMTGIGDDGDDDEV